MFCLALRPKLTRFREDFRREGVKTFAYMNNISVRLVGVTANTVLSIVFLQHKLDGIGIAGDPTKTVGSVSERTRTDGGKFVSSQNY